MQELNNIRGEEKMGNIYDLLMNEAFDDAYYITWMENSIGALREKLMEHKNVEIKDPSQEADFFEEHQEEFEQFITNEYHDHVDEIKSEDYEEEY